MADESILLKNIDSLYFDSKLDNINGKCANCSSCYTYGNNLKNPFSFQLLCHRFVKNIEYIPLSIDLNTKNLKEKRYDDLIYWILNMIKKMNDEIEQTEINNIINELIKIWKEVNKKLPSNRVKEEHLYDPTRIITPLNFTDLKRKKRMSDYCQNFSTLQIKLTNYNKPQCHIYYNYFKNTMEAYNDVSVECNETRADTSKCPYLCKNNDYNPERILSKLNCHKIPVEKSPPKLITEEKCNMETDKLKSELGQALLAANNHVFSYSDPRVVVLILFSFLGIILTCLFLYKITPISSLIRNNLLRKKLVRHNFDETVDDESIYDYSGNENTNMQNVEYNVSYNSDWNHSQ
ncbi:PIR Superfamily Protein [Plasmodium ovale curtisi]|uniref:PIR Superfamily Protein n=1 Tax=Plasmodium ovale curtisi TaxID=864141 RepID=A0A1A8X3D2_PLAOA|nr:PIR Superfamily Protein [Plasmodium ovale curtisi]